MQLQNKGLYAINLIIVHKFHFFVTFLLKLRKNIIYLYVFLKQ